MADPLFREVPNIVALKDAAGNPGETAALPSVPDEDFRHLEVGEIAGLVGYLARAGGAVCSPCAPACTLCSPLAIAHSIA